MSLLNGWMRDQWRWLTEVERETAQFAMRHCSPYPEADAKDQSCVELVFALRELQQRSHGYGRDAQPMIEKLFSLLSKGVLNVWK